MNARCGNHSGRRIYNRILGAPRRSKFGNERASVERKRIEAMKTIVKLVTGAALASGLALAAAVPANAGVSIGIGIGGPGPGPYGGDWCARHPYRCNHYGG